jgi:hypothetical protein
MIGTSPMNIRPLSTTNKMGTRHQFQSLRELEEPRFVNRGTAPASAPREGPASAAIWRIVSACCSAAPL